MPTTSEHWQNLCQLALRSIDATASAALPTAAERSTTTPSKIDPRVLLDQVDDCWGVIRTPGASVGTRKLANLICRIASTTSSNRTLAAGLDAVFGPRRCGSRNRSQNGFGTVFERPSPTGPGRPAPARSETAQDRNLSPDTSRFDDGSVLLRSASRPARRATC